MNTMRTLTLGFLLVMLAFAGCLSGNDDPEPTTSSSSSSTSRSSTSTSSTGTTTSSSSTSTSTAPTPNQAPTGSISAAINGTLVDFNLTGSDADNDALTWTLTFGDGNQTNGSFLPAAVNHAYAAGNYSAVFNLTDGEAVASYNVSLSIVAAAAAGPQVVSGSVVGDPVSCAQYADGSNDPYGTVPLPLDGTAWAKFDVAPSTLGKAFSLDIVPAAPAGGPFELQFYATNNAGTDYFDSSGPTAFDISGTVPAGSAFAVLYACSAGPADFTYTAG